MNNLIIGLGSLVVGVMVGSIYNVGVHFIVVNTQRIKEKMKEGITYYSQFGQDKWVLKDIFNFKREGYFVELGAGDGINKSNTYTLEKGFNWKGLCIEANRDLFEKLKSNRKCICINECVSNDKKKVKFSVGKGLNNGIVNIGNNFEYKETIKLEDIFNRNNVPKIIDYFSLDVEGHEFEILKNFPFNKYTFLAINIERPNKELLNLLKTSGYIKVGSNPCDSLFINKILGERNEK